MRVTSIKLTSSLQVKEVWLKLSFFFFFLVGNTRIICLIHSSRSFTGNTNTQCQQVIFKRHNILNPNIYCTVILNCDIENATFLSVCCTWPVARRECKHESAERSDAAEPTDRKLCTNRTALVVQYAFNYRSSYCLLNLSII